MDETTKLKNELIDAGYKAVKELIKVAESNIMKMITEGGVDDLAADKMKNAAAAKKLAIFDAFEILDRIDKEKELLNPITTTDPRTESNQSFAEQRAK